MNNIVFIGLKPKDLKAEWAKYWPEKPVLACRQKVAKLANSIFICLILYVRAYLKNDAYSKFLLKARQAEKILQREESLRGPTHRPLREAREVFLSTLQTGAYQKSAIEYLEVVEWTNNSGNNFVNDAHRLFKVNFNEEQGKQLKESLPKELHNLYKCFADFRSRLNDYQEDLSKIWKGPTSDPELKGALSSLQAVISRVDLIYRDVDLQPFCAKVDKIYGSTSDSDDAI